MSKPQHITMNKDGRVDEDPADMHIPDDYVGYALRNSKPLPPITWRNWWKELNYLSVAILTISPSIAIYGALTTKLRWETAALATFYYFFTGLGSYRATAPCSFEFSPPSLSRHHGWLPPPLVASFLQRVSASSGIPCSGRCRRRPGFYQMVGSGPPRTPPLHRHRP
jgi:hypothetical protein